MKKALISNAILISLIILMFVYTYIIVDFIEPIFIYFLVTLLLAEAVIFLNTFIYFKKSIIERIRKVLAIYSLVVLLLFVISFIYSKITGYVFIYSSYRILYISFLIYPIILLIMLSLMNAKIVGEKNKMVTGLTSVFVVVLMLFHGVICIFGVNKVELIKYENTPNTVLVTNSMWLHGTIYEYEQVNLFYMEYVGINDSW